ncbi:hypothetical protein K449DRAFT_434368 [Hypoxylon sp. EC38]|nr:hypothetical protein K449DRAFT_434368 [Hypoxylon sp. EC38]
MSVRKKETTFDNERSLPFCFGCEFEVMIRPKTTSGLQLPPDASSVSEQRRFNFRLLDTLARVMTGAGLESAVFDAAEQEKPDYSKWNMMLDGSLSKRHIPDGFYPVEIVSPVLVADAEWTRKIDLLWSTLHQYFEFRKDTSCGFHEPATARCAPLSRQDRATEFCRSNLRSPRLQAEIKDKGPLMGIDAIFKKIDSSDREEIIDIISPAKYFAWNFQPSKEGRSGSIEFRRPPGVDSSKKTKHWVAFAMAFIWMSVTSNPQTFIDSIRKTRRKFHRISHPDFQERFVLAAKEIGEFWNLDPRLQQEDDVEKLHITMMNDASFEWLRRMRRAYRWSDDFVSDLYKRHATMFISTMERQQNRLMVGFLKYLAAPYRLSQFATLLSIRELFKTSNCDTNTIEATTVTQFDPLYT